MKVAVRREGEGTRVTWAIDLARLQGASGAHVPLFGVIVYTDAHPNLKKVLRDEDYWRALAEKSGRLWNIFSVRARQGRWASSAPPPGTIAMLTEVWKEPSANLELLSAFGMEDTKNLPALVIFVLEQKDVCSRVVVRLDESTAESAYASLRDVVEAVAKALAKLNTRDLGRSEAVFEAVEATADWLRGKKRLKETYRLLKELRDWLPLV